MSNVTRKPTFRQNLRRPNATNESRASSSSSSSSSFTLPPSRGSRALAPAPVSRSNTAFAERAPRRANGHDDCNAQQQSDSNKKQKTNENIADQVVPQHEPTGERPVIVENYLVNAMRNEDPRIIDARRFVNPLPSTTVDYPVVVLD